MGSNPIGPTDSGRAGYGTLPADKHVPADNQGPADNHVHSQWSHDTGPGASMAYACARAIELGLPAVAFTEHLDFTDWGPGDPIAGTGIRPNDKWGPRPLDIGGYLACLDECRQRFPSLRILSGAEAGEPHLFAGSAAAVLSSGRFDRVLGSVHTLPSGGRLVYAPALLRRGGRDDRGQRPVRGARAPGLPPAVLARGRGPLPGVRLRGGVPHGAAGAGRFGPGAGAEHGPPARVGGPAALVARGRGHGAVLRQLRAPARLRRRAVPRGGRPGGGGRVPARARPARLLARLACGPSAYGPPASPAAGCR